ncbi:hypothetical protein [Streptomyces sp. NPDC056069]|uniref:hypothetical protein n=1 Tax=Streptomyces sp. NPDC056069 TaxID=3345702 RepID=UPI0035E0F74B
MSAGDDSTPAARLALLQAEYLRPRKGAAPERTATNQPPSAPIRLGVYDHLEACISEVVADARAAKAPEPTPRPRQLDGLYGWYIEQTAHLDAGRRQARDSVIYRQGLEHAVLMGDTSVIRPHPCPACATWGLFWSKEMQAIVCANRHCVDEDGLSTRWTFADIADAHIRRQVRAVRRAT